MPKIKQKIKEILLWYKPQTLLAAVIFSVGLFLLQAPQADAAVLLLSPGGGTYTVGSTFDVSVFLNTEGKPINAISVSLSFPPDKLQLVSPSTGKSVIGVWTLQPNFNNQSGKVELEGGVPGGITVSNGLITTLTFRVKSVGQAIVRFSDQSKVLLHDGHGTDDLNNTSNGIYTLILPPPAGPIVVSQTHPDQGQWYANPNVYLSWANDEDVQGYSYMLSKEPIDNPDDIVDSRDKSVTYKNLSNGTHYFHIKALREGSWGGSTHFALKIDTESPAEFPVSIIPSARTTRKQPIFEFSTTDSLSGVDHYELKIIPLELDAGTDQETKDSDVPLYIEATSPYVPQQLSFGKYDIIVRAYDKAGNIQEVSRSFRIATFAFEFIGDRGLQLSTRTVLPWPYVALLAFLLLLLLMYIGYRLRRWRKQIELLGISKELPTHIQSQLDELATYRQRYGKIAVLLLFLAAGWFGFGSAALAEGQLSPPLITTLSKDISNEEIFYTGGKTDTPSTEVQIYLQSLTDGQTTKYTVTSDKKGDWFYRHDAFLTGGQYLIWTQGKIGEQLSPPSPQQQISVKQTAIQFGSTRISLDFFYITIILVLVLAILGMVFYIVFHSVRGRTRHKELMRELRDAEESIRRGFAVLKRDIESELAVIHRAKLAKELSEEERQKEDLLLKDLEDIQQRLGREIWEIETQQM